MATSQTTRRLARTERVFTYDAAHAPAIRVTPGERLLVETQNAFGDSVFGPGDTLASLDLSVCDPMTGPIWVEGAEPGDALAVTIERIEVVGTAAQGVIPNFGTLPWESLPLHFFTPKDGRITWLRGIEIEVRPNLGVIGVAPAEGPIPSIYPGDHGGNMDTKYVCEGSTVLLPVFHPGAGLVVGDCHQIQGDGELCGVAPETDAEVTLTIGLVKGARIPRPRILARERFMVIASAESLEEAVQVAVRDAIDMLVAEKGFTEDEAYLLLTVKADIEICQVVDPLMTVRVAMDRTFWEQLPDAQDDTED
jgi:amidase